ncbi:GNAT family N-acetyltransferase [soil metagenome]
MPSAGSVDVVQPNDRPALKAFSRLDRELLGDHPNHVAALEVDTRRVLGGKSAFNEGLEHAMFVLRDSGGVAIGGAVAYVNRRWQQHHRDAAGFIGNLTLADSVAAPVLKVLFDAAELWLRDRGADRVIVGVDGTGLVGLGLHVAIDDSLPMFPGRWNPPHWVGLIEACGYSLCYPLLSFEVDFLSSQYRDVAQRAIDTAQCRIRPIDKRKWKAEFEVFGRIFNDGFAAEWELNPYSTAEFLEAAGALKPIADPNTFLFAEVDGEPVGICFGMPDLSPLMQTFRGKLGPLQLARLLRGGRRPDHWGLVGIAVSPEHRGKHIGQTLAATLFRHFESLGMRSAPYYWVNEHNVASCRLAQSFGGVAQVTRAAFDKRL